MDRTRHLLKPGLWLDYRRAAFLEKERALVLADLHLGYNWAHRFNGQMLPLQQYSRSAERLSELIAAYHPAKVVLLGDILHQTVPVQAIEKELRELVEVAAASAELILVRGNHDKNLKQLSWANEFNLCKQFSTDEFLLVHGDRFTFAAEDGRFVIIGHEHPAIGLGDGVATSAKFPCFLASARMLILPAFSLWAAGSPIGAYKFMSPAAREESFTKAVAIMGDKLLPVPVRNKVLQNCQ